MIYITRNEIQQKAEKISKSGISIFLIAAFALVIFYSETAASAVLDTLSLCFKVIVPSLFPFMVLAELLAAYDTGSLFDKITFGLFSRLFKLPSRAAAAFFMGVICGFPVGAKVAVSLFSKGELSKDAAERLLPLTACASPAFVISAVGGGMYGSVKIGFLLYISQLIVNITLGILSAVKSKAPPPSSMPAEESPTPPLSKIFTHSVTDGAMSCISVCGFIIFFSVLAVITKEILTALNAEALNFLILPMFEISGGCQSAAALFLPSKLLSLALTSATISWSGLSVAFQINSLTEGSGISLSRYFFSKILSALLSPVIMLLLYAAFL